MQATATLQREAAEAQPALRTALVDFDQTWLRTPLNHRLRIWGQGVGGYASADGSVYRYGDELAAHRAAAIWIETGIYPAYQTEERIAAARVAARAGVVA